MLNTEVKLSGAENTCLETDWEDRKVLALSFYTDEHGKAAEWHSLLSSKGVTANFFADTCEKMRHEGG